MQGSGTRQGRQGWGGEGRSFQAEGKARARAGSSEKAWPFWNNYSLLLILAVWSACFKNTPALLVGMIHSDEIPLSPQIIPFNTGVSVPPLVAPITKASLIWAPVTSLQEMFAQ